MKRKPEDIKEIIRERYGRAIEENACGCSSGSCCSGVERTKNISREIGYTDSQMDSVPEGSNLGFGCGNPVAIASLKEGDVVLDLGSGAGFDAFLSASKVGNRGHVIGVDMTPEMVKRASDNAKKGNFTNVEFRLGEIEKLPVNDNSVDVVISNCVINLSPDKEAVFKEAFRVLKPGGRLMVSDLVLIKQLPDKIKESIEAYVGCLAGAIDKQDYLEFISVAGFSDVKVVSQSSYPVDAMFDGFDDAKNAIASVKVSAIKMK